MTWTPAAATPIRKVKDSPPLPPVWVYPPTAMAGKILGKPVFPPEYQDMVIWFPKTEIPPFYISFCIAQSCPHPDMMEELASYIAGEMNRNIHDPAVLEMRELNSYDTAAETKKFLELPWYAMAGATSPQTIGYANATAALALWTERVGQNRPWDHKPKLQMMYNGNVWHKQGKYAYYYDIWSNIHYGYVGMAGGLSESVLLDGAGAEQIVSDGLRKAHELLTKPEEERTLPGPHPTANPWTELRSWDDVADRVSVSIGVKLYKQHPNGGVTAKMIMDEVLAVEPDSWGDGIEDHICS